MKALKISFLMTAFVGNVAAWGQSPPDPVLLDPLPAALPEPTLPVPMPEPAFPKEAETEAARAFSPSVTSTEKAPDPETPADVPPPKKPAVWECQLPSGSFLVRVPDMVTVSHHSYVIEGVAKISEVTISTRSAVVARFYHEELAPRREEERPMLEPLVEGRAALQRAQALVSSGRYVTEDHPPKDDGLPHKAAAEGASAVDFQLERKADVLAIYQSAREAWKEDVSGLFRLME